MLPKTWPSLEANVLPVASSTGIKDSGFSQVEAMASTNWLRPVLTRLWSWLEAHACPNPTGTITVMACH